MNQFSTMLEDVKRTAELCVKCNICTSACPVLRVTDLFPGPKYVGPQAQRFRDPHRPSIDKSLDYCSGCGICTQVCPHGVRVMEINTLAKAALRARQVQEHPLDNHLWRNWVLGHNELLGQLGSPVAPLANFMMELRLTRWILQQTLGIDRRAPIPRFSFTPFRRWFCGRSRRAAHSDHGTRGRQVVYFHGCATNYYEPEVGRAVVGVLEHNGFEVILPDQNCCGLPMQSNGDSASARKMARGNIRKLSPYARRGIPILVAGASCGLTLKSDYIELQGMHDEDARVLAEHVYDLSEFLWLEYQAGRLKTDFIELNSSLPYHTACHQKLQRIGQPALELLSLVAGLRLVHMDADCCGIAGTYGYKHEKYDIAQAIGQPLFGKIHATGSPVAVCDNETCRWNIAANTSLKVFHSIQVLAQAYGLAGFENVIRKHENH